MRNTYRKGFSMRVRPETKVWDRISASPIEPHLAVWDRHLAGHRTGWKPVPQRAGSPSHIVSGYTLIEVIAMLPVLAAVIVTGFQAAGWLVHAQALEGRMLSNQAMVRDIVRRVQADTRLAESAVVRRGEGAGVLELRSGRNTIIYRFEGARIERAEQPGDTAPVRYEWLLDRATADVKHEAIGASKGVVWVLFDCRLPMGEGHEVNRHLAAAALVGGGGAS